jgi:hypothetical protein
MPVAKLSRFIIWVMRALLTWLIWASQA